VDKLETFQISKIGNVSNWETKGKRGPVPEAEVPGKRVCFFQLHPYILI
jgi:hypothetical protein